ncbi:MAG: ABC transporter permease [Acidimicrobiales bacterium]
MTVNPVLERELRQRLRGRAAWVVLFLYLAVLGVILKLVYDVAAQPGVLVPLSDAQTASTVGRSIFHWLLFFMLGLICFIVPGLTAAAIAGERERQTLIPLQVTLLGARSIVYGKLVASLAFVVLLLIAALPLVSVSFLLGGVDVVEVAKGMAMLLVVAVAIACLSLACSSAFGRTQTATVAAYGIVAALVIGTPIAYGAQRALDTSIDGTSKPTLLVVNPFAATADVVRGRTIEEPGASSPFTGIQDLLGREVFADDVAVGDGQGITSRLEIVDGRGIGVGQVIAPAPGFPPPLPAEAFVQFRNGRPEVAGLPFWAASLLAFAGLSAVGVFTAVWRIKVPGRGRAG